MEKTYKIIIARQIRATVRPTNTAGGLVESDHWPLFWSTYSCLCGCRGPIRNCPLSILFIHLFSFTQNPPTHISMHVQTHADTFIYPCTHSNKHLFTHISMRSNAHTSAYARTHARTHAHTRLKHRDPPIIRTATAAEPSLGKHKSKLRDSRVVNMTVVCGYARHCTDCERL